MAVRQDASTGKMVDDGKPIETPSAPENVLAVKVYSPFRTYYDDVAVSLSAINKTGPFDILPQHHNFISLLDSCDVVIARPGGDTQRIKIAGGILHVRSNRATVMLDV